MDLLRFFRVMRRGFLVIIAASVIGAVLGAGLGALTSHSAKSRPTATDYQAVYRFGLDPVAAAQAPSTELASLDVIAQLTDDPTVRSAVASKLGGDSAALAGRVSTVVTSSKNTLDVDAVGTTKGQATALVKATAAAMLATYNQRLTTAATAQSDQLSKRLDDLKARQQSVEAQLAAPGLSVVDQNVLSAQRDALVNQYRIAYDRFISLGTTQTVGTPLFTLQPPQVDPISAAEYAASLERARTATNHLTADGSTPVDTASVASAGFPVHGPAGYGMLGAILGAILGSILVVARDRLDGRLLTGREFEDALDAPVLAEIERLPGGDGSKQVLVSLQAPFGPAAEAYRAVRSSLLLLAASDDLALRHGLVVMVGSAVANEGKSTTAANLAVAFAESGRSVLAVNCDYRRPSLHKFFDLDKDDAGIMATTIAGLDIAAHVASGEHHPGSVSEHQRAFVEMQRPNYDVIIVDTSPLLSTADPIDMLSVVDLVLIVGRVGVTKPGQARAVAQLLDRHQAPLSGVLVFGVDERRSGYSYYYHDAPTAPTNGARAAVRWEGGAGAPRAVNGHVVEAPARAEDVLDVTRDDPVGAGEPTTQGEPPGCPTPIPGPAPAPLVWKLPS